MKPENALTFLGSMEVDLSEIAVEDALFHLKLSPLCVLRIHAAETFEAQRIAQAVLPGPDKRVTCPRIHIVIDETYKSGEWSVEYNGKVFWSRGA